MQPERRQPLASIPALERAHELARQLRARVGYGPSAPVDLKAVCDSVGALIADAPLGAGAGGRQALLVPRDDGSFRIVVDDSHGGRRPDTARHRRRQSIAHEVGHTLFYGGRDGARPRRCAPPGGTSEEAFCDEFARALLVPTPPGAVTANVVLSLQQRHDVSLEVAARAAAGAPGHPSVGLWWWRADGGPGAPLVEQWSSSAAVGHALDIVGFRTKAAGLRDQVAALPTAGPRLSALWLQERRQVLAVLNG